MTIEAARTIEHGEPADEFLREYEASKSFAKRERAADVYALLEEWALYGKLQVPRQQRHLRGDLWEIKTPHLRFPYYEVMDQFHGRLARLTHGFAKDTGKTQEGKTPRRQISWGLRVIREDRAC